MIRSEAEAVDRKQRIRDRYKGVDTSELEVMAISEFYTPPSSNFSEQC